MLSGYVEPDRETVLAECIANAKKWTAEPGRNLVILFDGTGNILGNHQDTNVVKLLRLLQKNTADDAVRPAQIVYYDPGVGTANEFPASSIAAKVGGFFRKLGGLALGSGAFENIAQAYEFLVRNYRDGDRIFLFGFSRGAFTARAVGGMLNMFGLIHEAGLPLIPTLVQNYFAPSEGTNAAGITRKQFAKDIIEDFSLQRTPLVHFVGVWDSVETIGSGFLGGIKITNKSDLKDKRFVHVRHALSLHETRCKYSPRRYKDPDFTDDEKLHRSFDERWFRGVHSDVGGSYNRDGLSNITLKWMVDEAVVNGLLTDHQLVAVGNPSTAMHDQTYESPFWVWTGLNSREREKSDVIDVSALPVGNAVQASRVPRTKLYLQLFGIILAIVTAVLFGFAFETSREVFGFDQAHGWRSNIPSAYQLLAPWNGQFGLVYDEPKIDQIHKALKWDWWLIASYALWMAYPLTWAVRRLIAHAIPQGKPLVWLARNVQWLMLALVLLDISKTAATYWIVPHPWVVTLLTIFKFIYCAMLLIVFAAGVLMSQNSFVSTKPASPVKAM